MVYFLWDRLKVRIKIGGTRRLSFRLAEQGVFDNDRYIFIGVMEGEKHSEYCIQTYVNNFAVKYGSSDWFQPCPWLATFVNRRVLPVTQAHWERDASTDDSPHAAIILEHLVTNAYGDWFERLAKHVGISWTSIYDHAIRHYAASVGFHEPIPGFPRPPRRRRPLLKRDKSKRWWVYCSDSQKYLSGDLEGATRP